MPATLRQVRTRIAKGSAHDALLPRFAELLFAKADPEFLEAFGSDALVAMAVDGLEFLHALGGDELRVEAFDPSFPADGWEAPYTVLRLCLPDRPFIVDSVRAELRRRGVRLHHLLHPILSVERGGNGRVERLDERARAGRSEAFEMFFLERLEPGRREALEASVRGVLEDVILATRDYRAMRERALELSGQLRELRDVAAGGPQRERAEELEEDAEFLAWLDDDNFVFLGYREYDLLEREGGDWLQVDEASALGVLSKLETSAYRDPVPLSDIPEGLRERVTGGRVLTVTKTNAESTVHRPARMDYIGIKKIADGWRVRGEQRFVGLFTSKALATPVEEIPILRRKLRKVLELDDAIPESHDWKQIITVFDSMPRTELFLSDAAQLHRDIRTVMGLERESGVRMTLREDPLGRGLAVMVIMPRERFNAEVRRRIQELLAGRLNAEHVDYQLAMGEDEQQVRFHFFFVTSTAADEVDARGLERDVAMLTRTWDDELRERLAESVGEAEGRRLADRYLPALEERYRADVSSGAALRDLERLEALDGASYLVDLINPVEEGRRAAATLLKVYHHQRTLVLSDVLPILENLGLRVLEQTSYAAELPEGVRGVDVFRVQDASGAPLDVRAHRERLVEALTDLLGGRSESDRLNRLVLYGGLTARQVSLLRAYQMYYAQITPSTSRSFVNDALLAHPRVAAALVAYHAARFDPALEGDRDAAMAEAAERVLALLADVASLAEDTVLRGVFNLMEASVRSSYFLGLERISFKIRSADVASMPAPRPLFEIGVSAPDVEGTHLRGGPVARGGIRWSDRPDDFRTEILGLMKTQMTKNAVIVPVGSKGGFVVKRPPADRDALREHVRACYSTFIRALLDLTDNRVGDETVHPEGLVIHDGPDPYLVVAADKGTATFSDTANAIAQEFGFWLGDAFASGGSQGYDHKAEGITARGAWECVARHFREMGHDVRSEPFTAVGIGDMSGDVFGNGMIYTDRLRLVAAFNHMHVFLDPDPDPEVGFAERRRLFELPRSTWRDYDPAKISEGGGVFDRGAKRIELHPAARRALGVDAEALSGQELVRAILRAPVDLLWNGGIGTYVRASTESDADAGDASNDPVRVTADELRCKVVGEGGNLGLTQLARVEYALRGGRINTDAIDNSGGVDMSDHEVNIKILFRPLLAEGELAPGQRNRLLKEMTDEVSALVLKDNYYQSLALSLAERRTREDPWLFFDLQEYLEERGGLVPEVEDLPTRRAFAERVKGGGGHVRPELAVLMAYAKMGLYRRLLETSFPDEEPFRHYLYGYFPGALQEGFPEAILRHDLRREIIATQFTNTVVDLLGVTFVHRMRRDTGATAVETIRAALVALELLESQEVLARLFALDGQVPAETQYAALDELVRAVEGIVAWILLSDLSGVPVEEFVDRYRAPLRRLRSDLPTLLPGEERRVFEERRAALEGAGLEPALAGEVAAFDYLPTSVGLIDVSRSQGVDLDEAARRFYALGARLSLGWLRDSLADLPAATAWEKVGLGGLVMDLRGLQRDLAERWTAASRSDPELELEEFLRRTRGLLPRYDDALGSLRESGELGFAGGTVLARLLAQALR